MNYSITSSSLNELTITVPLTVVENFVFNYTSIPMINISKLELTPQYEDKLYVKKI